MKTLTRTLNLITAKAAPLVRGRRAMVIYLALSAGGLCSPAIAEEHIITFNAPGAGTSAGQGTLAFSINRQGAIAGYYVDNSNVYHGFVRHEHGHITTFDVAGAGMSAYQGTLPYGSNAEGTITGF